MKAMIKVSKTEITKQEVVETLRVYGTGYQNATIIVDCFEEKKDHYLIPAVWAIENGLCRAPIFDPRNPWPKNSFKPRGDQGGTIKEIVDYLKFEGSGLFFAKTGYGKTCVALAVAKELGAKTLFLAHKTDILKQTARTAKEMFNVGSGKIMGKECDYSNLLTFSTMQTMAKRVQEDPKWLDEFQFLIVDEGHRASAASYQHILKRMNVDYRLGISATFRRSDGLEKVWTNYIGHKICEGINKKQKKITLVAPSVPVGVTTRDFYDWQGQLTHSKALNVIAEDEKYNNRIVADVVEILKAGRRPILVTDRKIQLEILEDKLVEVGIEVGIYAGGKHREKTIKPADLVEAMQKQVVLATTRKISEGYDSRAFLGDEIADNMQELDTMFILSMTSDSEQVIGRISREEKSKNPLIIHYVPNISYCVSIFRKAFLSTYKPLGIEVKTSL